MFPRLISQCHCMPSRRPRRSTRLAHCPVQRSGFKAVDKECGVGGRSTCSQICCATSVRVMSPPPLSLSLGTGLYKIPQPFSWNAWQFITQVLQARPSTESPSFSAGQRLTKACPCPAPFLPAHQASGLSPLARWCVPKNLRLILIFNPK